MPGSRRLLSGLRELMAAGAGGPAVLHDLVTLVADEMVAEVCSVYTLRPGDLLELTATCGLNPGAVGRTRLRVGEGIVGVVAATGQPQNLPDAQNHPAFAYRAETGELPFTSLLAVPVRRAGRVLGVLAVQNRASRRYADDELDVLQTVAMLLAEMLGAGGAVTGAEDGIGAAVPRLFQATALAPGVAIGPVVVHGTGAAPRRVLADDPAAEMARLRAALATMRRDLDLLIQERLPAPGDRDHPDLSASREVMEATRLVAANDGWMRRVSEAVASGLSAEAAVHRVVGELRDGMRRIVDPYLRERLADLEDLAARLLAALDGKAAPEADATGAILLARRLGPAQLLQWHARGIAGESEDRAVVRGVGGVIEQAHAVDGANRIGHRRDDLGPPPLADVGHAFDDHT